MFRIFRELEEGEFIIVGGDCSQGGKDSNFSQFFSTKYMDFPIVYEYQGVAANMTSDIFPVLEWIFDRTGVKPIVGFERNNGGGSEMERLKVMNRNQKYNLFVMPNFGKEDNSQDTGKLGWDTNTATRPKLISEWKNAFDSTLVKIYDVNTISQHKTFVVNRQNKPEAEQGFHDDAVISCAVSWQIYQITPKPQSTYHYSTVRENEEKREKWSMG